jgi:hypothetical protein
MGNVEDCMLCLTFCTCSGTSGTPPHSFTHHHPSPIPISEDWTPHLSLGTCSSQSTPLLPLVLLSFPASYWLPLHFLLAVTISVPIFQGHSLHPEDGATGSSNTLVSYCSTGQHHNPEDLYLNNACCVN